MIKYVKQLISSEKLFKFNFKKMMDITCMICLLLVRYHPCSMIY